jgi:hypothetical protein
LLYTEEDVSERSVKIIEYIKKKALFMSTKKTFLKKLKKDKKSS